jgi:hypothetical protein
MSSFKYLRPSNGKFSLFQIIAGAVLTVACTPLLIQTFLWATSDNWKQSGNAMPLLMIFIIPLAIVAFAGFFIGLVTIGLGLSQALRVPIPESLSDVTRGKILNRNILIFILLHLTLLNLNEALFNTLDEFSHRGIPIKVVIFVLVLLQLTAGSFATYYTYLTKKRALYLGWGLAILITLIWSALQIGRLFTS